MSPPAVEAYLLSGAGNDFLALVEPASTPAAATIRAWCRRGLSVGADGLFVLDRTAGGARMRYWNADGSSADLCLNGSRCAARLAFHLGWGDGDSLCLDTAAGRLAARQLDEHAVCLRLPDIVGAGVPHRLEVAAGGETRRLDTWQIGVGVPHLVVPWPTSLADLPIADLGPRLRSHPALGAAGANVDFARFSQTGFELRCFERGVEAETLACGTGVVATAAVGAALGVLSLPARGQTAGGFALTVEGTLRAGRLRDAALGGDARLIAHCRLLDGAGRVPTTTVWR